MKTAIECNWTNYDYQSYIDYYNQQTNETRDITIYMENLIYTLETKEEGEYLKTINKEIEKEVTNMVVPDVPCKPINKVKKCTKSDQELYEGICRKKCNENQSRNKKTKRCNKIVKCDKPDQEMDEGKCRKKCNENQTRNENTKRCNTNKTVKYHKPDQEVNP
jgi:hypothetical protein